MKIKKRITDEEMKQTHPGLMAAMDGNAFYFDENGDLCINEKVAMYCGKCDGVRLIKHECACFDCGLAGTCAVCISEKKK